MGPQASTSYTQTIQQDPETILQKLDDKVTLKTTKNYKILWLDGEIYSPRYKQILQEIKKYCPIKIDLFAILPGLIAQINRERTPTKYNVICSSSAPDKIFTALETCPKICKIFLESKNQERSNYLNSQYQKIQKILNTQNITVEVIELLRNENYTAYQWIRKCKILFFNHENISRLNQYRLNFHFLILQQQARRQKESLNNFIRFCEHLLPNDEEISLFYKEYKECGDDEEKKRKTILGWLLKNSFFWTVIEQIPQISVNPKILAYVRFPFKSSYSSIKYAHQKMIHRLNKAFIIITPNRQEKQVLARSARQFICFTSFVRGYTNKQIANKIKKQNKQSFLCTVYLINTARDAEFDYGYWINQSLSEANVLFNIFNYFTIEEIDQRERTMVLKYGSLADISYQSMAARKLGNKLEANQESLLRNCYYQLNAKSNIYDQAQILQMAGYTDQAIRYTTMKWDNIRTSSIRPTQKQLDKQLLQLGDMNRINQNYSQAQQNYKNIETEEYNRIAHVHLAELYLLQGKMQEFQNIVLTLIQQEKSLENQNIEQSFKSKKYISLSLMLQQPQPKYKQAKKLLKELNKNLTLHYKEKVESLPLANEIKKSIAICYNKTGSYEQSISWISSIIKYQEDCEGTNSINVLETQKLKLRFMRESESMRRNGDLSEEIRISDSRIEEIERSLIVNDLFFDRQEARLNNSALFYCRAQQASRFSEQVMVDRENIRNIPHIIDQQSIDINASASARIRQYRESDIYIDVSESR